MNFSSTALLVNDFSMSGAEDNNQDGKHIQYEYEYLGPFLTGAAA